MTRPIAGRGGASGGSGLRVFRLLAGSVSATSLSVHVCRAARHAGWDGHRQAEAQGGFRLPVVSQQRLCADNVLSGRLLGRGAGAGVSGVPSGHLRRTISSGVGDMSAGPPRLETQQCGRLGERPGLGVLPLLPHVQTFSASHEAIKLTNPDLRDIAARNIDIYLQEARSPRLFFMLAPSCLPILGGWSMESRRRRIGSLAPEHHQAQPSAP